MRAQRIIPTAVRHRIAGLQTKPRIIRDGASRATRRTGLRGGRARSAATWGTARRVAPGGPPPAQSRRQGERRIRTSQRVAALKWSVAFFTASPNTLWKQTVLVLLTNWTVTGNG